MLDTERVSFRSTTRTLVSEKIQILFSRARLAEAVTCDNLKMSSGSQELALLASFHPKSRITVALARDLEVEGLVQGHRVEAALKVPHLHPHQRSHKLWKLLN